MYQTRDDAIELMKLLDILDHTVGYGIDRIYVYGKEKPKNLPKEINGTPIEFKKGVFVVEPG